MLMGEKGCTRIWTCLVAIVYLFGLSRDHASARAKKSKLVSVYVARGEQDFSQARLINLIRYLICMGTT